MVVVLPAGAQIPAKPPLNPAQLCRNLKNSSHSTDSLREAVVSFVSTLDVSSACSTLLYTLNIESVLPSHLNQRPTPREIGVVKFSLDLGVLDQKYHSFIDPGTLPRGFMHEAQYHSETHQIPVLDFKEVTTDCKSVYNDVINFLDSTNVVFTHSNLVHYTQEALDWIAGNSGSVPRRKVMVLPLETLSSELILLATGEIGHSIRLRDELRPQILEHVTHIGCVYHASRDIPVCGLSTSHRQAVATHGLLQKYFWDHLTKLDISCDLTPQHLREKSVLHSFTKCGITESDSSHSNRGTSHDHSSDSHETMDQSANRKLSENQSARSRLSENQSAPRRMSRDSDDSMSSMFTLPDIFQNNEEDLVDRCMETQSDRSASSRIQSDNCCNQYGNGNPQPPRRPDRLKSDPPQSHRKTVANTNQYKQFIKLGQTVQRAHQTRTNSSPQLHNSPPSQGSVNQDQGSVNQNQGSVNQNQGSVNQNQQSVNQPLKRVGLGRGFLKTASRIPPRRPNS